MINVSVIIPTYKPSEYIYECLDSLINQTINKTQFEIILILNGCNEPYYDQLSNFITEKMSDFNVNLIQTDIAGVSNARNIGLDNINGKYVTFIDDDDIVSKTYLSSMLNSANDNILAISDVRAFKENISNLNDDYISLAFNKYKNKTAIKSFGMRKFLSSACAKLISINVIGKHRFDTRIVNGEDSVFMIEISKNIYTMRLVPDSIYYRRLRHESASRRKKNICFITKNYYFAIVRCLKFIFTEPFNYNIVLVIAKTAALIRSYFYAIFR